MKILLWWSRTICALPTAHSLHFEVLRRLMLRIARNCSWLVGYSNVSRCIALRLSISIILTARLLLPLAVLAEEIRAGALIANMLQFSLFNHY